MFNRVMKETDKCDPMTHIICTQFRLSRAAKNIIPQNVCSKMKHNVVDADMMKKYSVPCLRPMVPGPTASANTLTRAKAPLMKPKPRPQTYANTCLPLTTSVVVTFSKPFSAFRNTQYKRYLLIYKID